jgi:hypothetical protein
VNILQVQAALTKLDDNQLKQEMLSPGMAPQFLVLSEMQRRKEIRQGGKPATPPPQSTLKDEAMAETGAPPAPQGIAALPEGAAAAQGVQGFAAGGAVSGGRYFVRDGIAYDLEALDPAERLALLGGSDITRPISRPTNLPEDPEAMPPATAGWRPTQPNTMPPTPPGLAFQQREAEIAAAGRAPYQPAMVAGTLNAAKRRMPWGLSRTSELRRGRAI